MSISQTVRTARGLAPDIVNVSKSYADVGPPNDSLGNDGNSYIDTASGIEYQKQNGTWEVVVDISAVGPPPTIPDPLSINQLNVNTVRGNAGDDVTIDAGNIGTCQILSNAADALQVGQVGSEDGVKIQNNGNIIAGSLVRGFNISALGVSNEVRLEEETGNMHINNLANKLVIENKAAGQDIDLITNGATCQILSNVADALQVGQVGSEDGVKIQNNGNVLAKSKVQGFTLESLSAGNHQIELGSGPNGAKIESTIDELDIISSDSLNITSNTGDVSIQAGVGSEIDIISNVGMNNNTIRECSEISTNNIDLSLKAGGLNAVSVKNVLNQEFIRMDGNNAAEFKMSILNPTSSNSVVIKGAGDIEKSGTAPLDLVHNDPLGNINLRTSGGGGVIRMNDGAGNITFDALNERATIDKVDTTSINNSSGLVNNSLLNVNTSGALSWRAYPRCIEMIQSGFGSNGTDYFNLGTSTVGPGEFWCTCTGNGRNLAEIDIRVISNAAWNLGGVGTAVIEVGYVPNNLPATSANFVVLRSVNIDNTADIYGVSFTGYNDNIPFRAAIAARSVLTGTSATATNIEITLNLTLV